MKLAATLILLAVLSPAMFAQNKPADPPAPTAPVDLQNKIMKIQLQEAQLNETLRRIQDQATQEFKQWNDQLESLKKDALAQMKLDPNEYDIDLGTFAAVKKPLPSTPPAPAKK
jgi:hypothetical protein